METRLLSVICLTGCIALSAESVFSRPLPEIKPISQTGDYPCYVVTNERRAFDLTSLCGGTSNSIETSANQANAASSTSATNSSHIGERTNSLNRRTTGNTASSRINDRNVRSRNISTSDNDSVTSSRWNWLPESYWVYSDSNSSGSASGGSGGSGGGNCNSPGDRKSNGARCGGNAASERPGGRR